VASKFQNRLVGTIILVALGVIILPGLLDGKKKHYEDEFASIPLVPKPGDVEEQDSVPPVTQSLPAQPPEGADQSMTGGQNTDSSANNTNAANHGNVAPGNTTVESQPPVTTMPEQKKTVQTAPVKPVQQKPKTIEPKPMAEAKPTVKPKPVEQPKPAEQPKAVAEQPKPVEQPKPAQEEKAPAGQSYVVQLGALKNAAKANEIVANLRLSGFRAYTVPATPVQGQITRLYVGPDASKQKLEASLPQLQQLSGLGGQVRAYSAH
jgi:DedD protein